MSEQTSQHRFSTSHDDQAHTPSSGNSSSSEAAGLPEALGSSIEGEVRFSPGARALYSTDSSNYRQVPIGLVVPKTIEDVVTTVALCRQYGVPIVSRGGGTSLAGQTCNAAVVIDFSKYLHHVRWLDADARLAEVDAGCVLDTLRSEANQYDLTFGPDPATHTHCTLGGMVGNNSCGIHAQMAGRTADNIRSLEILTYDGHRFTVGETSEDEYRSIVAAGGRRAEIYQTLHAIRERYAGLIRERYPDIPRRVSGYNLDQLLPEKGFNVARALVGTEGTCGVVLSATCELVPWPRHRALLVIGYPSIYEAGDDIPVVTSFQPIGCEGIDGKLLSYYERKNMLLRDLAKLPKGEGWLVVEFGGASKEEAHHNAQRL
ncbi:MAG: FAD-binding oxidoreductase, partial [Bdellovibrionales bacterium]|nr:FAD-binding oxidoreductase [Bdellovibrionales bacterium]